MQGWKVSFWGSVRGKFSPNNVMVAVRTCMVVACSSIDWLLQLPGAVLLSGRAPFVYWGVSNYCALTEVFLLPRIQLCSLHRLSWLLLSYDYRHDYFLVSSMLKLSSLKPSKYTRWILASIGRLVTNNKMNDFVGNILLNKLYAYCYILVSRTRRCDAAMLLSCNWCRNLDAANCIAYMCYLHISM